MTNKADRTLIYIPIVHTRADMGGLATSVQRLRVRKQGREVWSRSVDVVERLWAEIRTAVEGWALPWERVRLYQDGLPVCGREEEIVRDLARAGSPNHQDAEEAARLEVQHRAQSRSLMIPVVDRQQRPVERNTPCSISD